MQMQIFSICFQVLNSGERIVQMVFIRFQYHLQRHFVVLVVARLVVDITIMQVPIATRRFVFIPMDLQDLSVGLLQVPNKQWGINSAGNNGSEGESGWYAFPVNFNSACFALFCGLRNTDTNNPTNYDSEVQPRNWTTSKFNVYKQDYGGNPWFGSFIWFAIGRQPASYKL